ncbi:MAG TPA: hypothetical protein VM238_15260 [Phycisphaerae bacterium]|nr:hypothetical protein [Phycisphaerae bacterium]
MKAAQMQRKQAKNRLGRGLGRPFTAGDGRINRRGLNRGHWHKAVMLREQIVEICLSAISKDDKRTYIEALAAEHPRAFATLIAKILPAEVKVEAAVDLTAAMRDMSDEELERLAHATGEEETLNG